MRFMVFRDFGGVRSLLMAAMLIGGVFMGPSLFAQSEPQTLEQLKAAITRDDYANTRRAGYAARACDEFSDGNSCYIRANLAEAWAPDLGDESLQFSYYTKACVNGVGSGCRRAADMLATGRGRKQDKIGAYNLYASGCSKGDAQSCTSRIELTDQVKTLLAAKGYPVPSDTVQSFAGTATSRSPLNAIPDENEPFEVHRAELSRLTHLTATYPSACYALFDKLKPDGGKSAGELAERWYRMHKASIGTENSGCNLVPESIERQIRADIAASANRARQNMPSTQSSSNPNWCDSTCQREKTSRNNTPLRCYVSNGRRICNK